MRNNWILYLLLTVLISNHYGVSSQDTTDGSTEVPSAADLASAGYARESLKSSSDPQVTPTYIPYQVYSSPISQETAESLASVVFEEINGHLNTAVKNSNEPQSNFAELAKWQPTVCKEYTQFGAIITHARYTAFCAAVEKIIRLPEMLTNYSSCDSKSANDLILHDHYLGKVRSFVLSNSPYTKLDRILEYFAFQWADFCQGLIARPKLFRIFKVGAYNYINAHLVNATDSQDPAENIAKARELLDELTKNQVVEGTITDAVRQLVSMETVARERLCNSAEHETIVKNDLATSGTAHTNKLPPLRRIDKIVHHYSSAHAEYCLPMYMKRFGNYVQKVDETTSVRLTALITRFLLMRTNDSASDTDLMSTALADKIIALESPAVNLLSSRELLLLNSSKSISFDEYLAKKVQFSNFAPSLFYDYLRQFAINDSNVLYLDRVLDEVNGEFVIKEEQFKQLLGDYIFKPCNQFIRAIGPEVFLMARHEELVTNSTATLERISTNIKFYAGRITYNYCKLVTSQKENLVSLLINSIPPKSGRISVEDVYYSVDEKYFQNVFKLNAESTYPYIQQSFSATV